LDLFVFQVPEVSLIVYHRLTSFNNLRHFPYCCG